VFVIISINPVIAPSDLFRDVTTLAEVPFYTGMVSQLGALVWAASITSCFITFFLMKKLNAGSPQSRQFLVHAGLFSAFLLIDDMFLFHDEIAIEYLGLSQKKVYLAYLLVSLAFLYFNRNEILSSEYFILVIALGMFGMSIFLDVLNDTFLEKILEENLRYDRYEVFVEDGFKFIGIVTWLAFYLRYMYHSLIPAFVQNKTE
jgi:hypothetical protein